MEKKYIIIKNVNVQYFMSWVFKNGRDFKPNEIFIIEGELFELLYDKRKIQAYKEDLAKGIFVKEVTGEKERDAVINEIKQTTFKLQKDASVELKPKTISVKSNVVVDKSYSETDRKDVLPSERDVHIAKGGSEIETVTVKNNAELLEKQDTKDSDIATNSASGAIVSEGNGTIVLLTSNIARIKYDTGIFGTFTKPAGYRWAKRFKRNEKIKIGDPIFIKE